MTPEEKEYFLTAFESFASKRRAALDAEIEFEKLKLMLELERPEAPSQAAQQESDIKTVNEAAEYMKVSPRSIYNWVESGKLIPLRAGDDLRFDKAELDEWMRRDRKNVQPTQLRVVNCR